MITYSIIFIICLLGSIIQGVTSFGFAILAMAVLPFFIPFRTAAALVSLLGVTLTLQNVFRLRAHINIRLVIIPLIFALLGRTLGMRALMALNTDVLRIILGVVLILFSIYFIFFSGKITIKPTQVNGALAGLVSGVIGGMFNTGGPPLVVYYFSALDNKHEYTATMSATFALSSMYSVVLHLVYGNINMGVLKLGLAGILAVFAGGTIGFLIYNKLNRNILSKVIYSYMAVAGLMLVLKF